MRAWPLLALLLLVLPAALPASQAQLEASYAFALVTDHGTRADVPLNGQAILQVTFKDDSKDAASTLVPGAPPANVLYHDVSFTVTPLVEDPGWTIFPPTSLSSYGGTQSPVEVIFQVTAQASHNIMPVNLTAIIRPSTGGVYYANATIQGFSLGAKSFAAQLGQSFQVGPRQIVSAPIRIINLGAAPRTFDMEVVSDPCKMNPQTTNGNLVGPKSEEFYTVNLVSPSSKPYYLSELCAATLHVFPTGQPDIFQTVIIGVTVNGPYVDPVWVFDLAFLLIALLLLILFIARRKARVEEEILGKPQKPWTIPVEALYLKALREKDEHAWYVVRHYLMEDEYRSSLLWYKSFKKATKGARKKEGLVLGQEKGYERWKAAWRRKIARPVKQADRYDASLQRKLDAKARQAHRKQMAKYGKVIDKMKAAHAAQVERAGKAYAKAAAKAAKKGQPAPKRTPVPEPDYPDEPKLEAIPLASHKWAKKSARFRAKRLREQGDLEVKFEKADARRLRKVRRKVQKVAKKLDDPEFVGEHPLLKGE